ncbi:hypothetical protein [Gynuella sp.]|uniref:hypothetical protein n=1 Tax=Gynuella sp. TaxID=2969146 RepID=UPI003D126F60
MWAYYDPGAVNTTIGKYGVETYIWGDKEVEFVRCAHCGCITHYQTFEGDPEPRVAVNFRMADEEWVSGIDVRYFNGKEA